MRSRQDLQRIVHGTPWIAALLLCLLPLAAGAQAPTVNGLFYGDGDNNRYAYWNTSYYGSDLYVYYDAPNTRLYVALVVDRAVNDNVFGDSHNGYSGNYMSSAGWGGGGGQQRGAEKLTDSEFASFRFACAEGSPNEWGWQQGYACQSGGSWVSNGSCGASAVLLNGYPPTLTSASSFAWNMNTYDAAATKPWNRDFFGTRIRDWKSPFSFTNPSTSPANNPNTVIGFEGYPSPTNSGDLSQGPNISFNSTFQYEWAMVYEWSVNIGGNGTTTGTGCGGNALFLVTGQSHHSPMKSGVEGLYDEECGEENDCFPPGNNQNPLSDFGDLPSSYDTTIAEGGPRHPILLTGPYLGTLVEVEADGVPTSDASGDGTEEDGVSPVVTTNWTALSTQAVQVTVTNAPVGGATLGAWFDWNGDGDFLDAGEFFTYTGLTDGTHDLNVLVGSGFDWQNDTLHARFRLFSGVTAAPGGTLDQSDFAGTAADGEVEDYVYPPTALPVTLNAFATERSGGTVTARWQTASESENVAFELWGLVDGEWRTLNELVPTRNGSSALPQSYEVTFDAPAGLTEIQLVDYDVRGRAERFGAYRIGASYGEVQPVRTIDWTGPRAERAKRLHDRGFADVAGAERGRPNAGVGAKAAAEPAGRAIERWKKVRRGAPVRGHAAERHGAETLTVETIGKRGRGGNSGGGSTTVEVRTGPQTHVAVTEAGIQRVSYEALRDGGLDLAGVNPQSIAVTWRGEPVARWIDATGKFGPGSVIEFLGRPPAGDDVLYIDANLYQISVDKSRALAAGHLGQGKAKGVSPAYMKQVWVDPQVRYHHQSPTGDPWVERSVLVRGGRPSVVTLDVTVEEPVLEGPSRLTVGLGTVTDLPDLHDASGRVLPETTVEVWLEGAGAPMRVATGEAYGQQDWRIEAELPAGALQPGVNRIELRFATDYLFSLLVVDRWGVSYPTAYRGPALDFAPDPQASGYWIDGFSSSGIVAYAEGSDGALTRIDTRTSEAGGSYGAEVRQTQAARFWVTEAPHAPTVFTTEAPGDLLSEPGDLVVLTDSSFLGTPALDDYLAQKAPWDPVVIDVEDVFNAVGFGMRVPSAITDYLAARDAVHPFTHVQIVGTDCYDRSNRISSCVSFVPLPTAEVGANKFTPTQNRLVDLDGDGVGDKAVGQFSVRTEEELATIVAKGEAWETSGLSAGGSALLMAEESDGLHDFSAQIDRMRRRLGWSGSDVLELADHPQIQTARSTMNASLEAGRAVTVFSGHSSPSVWAFRALLTSSTAAGLTNAGRPTIMVPLACETTYDISPSANVLGHQLLFGGDRGALAISGAVALSKLGENELMAGHVIDGLNAGSTLGEAVLAGRRALGRSHQELQDNWATQGDVTAGLRR